MAENNTNTNNEVVVTKEAVTSPEKTRTTRILIIGATGLTGIPLVRQALEAGHNVSVLVRSPEKLPEEVRSKVTIIEGSSTDPETVMNALESITNVLVVIGYGKGSPKDLMTSTLNNVVAGMKKHGTRQLILLAGAAIAAPNDKKSGMGQRFMVGLMKMIAKDMMKDYANISEILEKEQELRWVVVRPPRLTKGALTQKVKSAAFMSLGPTNSISREDVAWFMIHQIDCDTFNHQYPMITQ